MMLFAALCDACAGTSCGKEDLIRNALARVSSGSFGVCPGCLGNDAQLRALISTHTVCPRSAFTSHLCKGKRENLAATKTGLKTLQFPTEASTAILSKYKFKEW